MQRQQCTDGEVIYTYYITLFNRAMLFFLPLFFPFGAAIFQSSYNSLTSLDKTSINWPDQYYPARRIHHTAASCSTLNIPKQKKSQPTQQQPSHHNDPDNLSAL